ncbi:uncharacterized protein LOC144128237 isoform X1 [Amblyomma americanum]
MDGDISAEQIETWAAYDRRWNETRRKRIAEETPEQRAVRLAKCREYAAARRAKLAAQRAGDGREHGQGFLTDCKAGIVVGTCGACGRYITSPPVPGVGTQTEAKHEKTQARALVRARGTQT